MHLHVQDEATHLYNDYLGMVVSHAWYHSHKETVANANTVLRELPGLSTEGLPSVSITQGGLNTSPEVNREP